MVTVEAVEAASAVVIEVVAAVAEAVAASVVVTEVSGAWTWKSQGDIANDNQADVVVVEDAVLLADVVLPVEVVAAPVALRVERR